MQTKKIPRGTLYHTLHQSLSYLFSALFCELKDGSKVKEFENEFAAYNGAKHCLAFPLARTAIYYALKSLNLPLGSEVLMSPITIKGILDAIVELGLVPVYVDLDPNTICFDVEDLQRKISGNTKVMLITYLFGMVPDVERIFQTIRDKDIFSIEDFSQCLNGAYNGTRVGQFGDVGVYSASSIKTLDTLGGGLLITNNPIIFESLASCKNALLPPNRILIIKKAWINLIRNLAVSQPIFSIITFPILRLLSAINPTSVLKQTGERGKERLKKIPSFWFYGYSSLQAKIGMKLIAGVQVSDAKRISNVDDIKLFNPSSFPTTPTGSRNVYWQLILVVSSSLKAQKIMAQKGIDCATSSLEYLPNLTNYPGATELNRASNIYINGLFIPCYPNLSDADVNRIRLAISSLN